MISFSFLAEDDGSDGENEEGDGVEPRVCAGLLRGYARNDGRGGFGGE